MCEGDRIWHILFCLIGRISKHHTLVSGTNRFNLCISHLIFFCFQSLIYAHGDITRLLVNGCNHTTGICIKSIFASGITDLANRITNDLLNIHICFCGDLTHNQNHTCSGSSFAGYTAHWILCQ